MRASSACYAPRWRAPSGGDKRHAPHTGAAAPESKGYGTLLLISAGIAAGIWWFAHETKPRLAVSGGSSDSARFGEIGQRRIPPSSYVQEKELERILEKRGIDPSLAHRLYEDGVRPEQLRGSVS